MDRNKPISRRIEFTARSVLAAFWVGVWLSDGFNLVRTGELWPEVFYQYFRWNRHFSDPYDPGSLFGKLITVLFLILLGDRFLRRIARASRERKPAERSESI
jgi:hypothetical protein